MMIIVLVALGLSLLCAVTLIGVCIISGRSSAYPEETTEIVQPEQETRPLKTAKSLPQISH